MSKLHLVVSTANMFAAAHSLPADGDPRLPAQRHDGEITVEGVATVLDVSREDAITVLVALRTFLHNQFIVPRAKIDSAASARLFGSDTALKAEAAAMLASMLDDIDEVSVRLDLRVAEGVPETVSLDDLAERDHAVVELASTMTPHEAAWFALRPDACPAQRHPFAGFERTMTQLQLPFVMGTPEEANSTNAAALGVVGAGYCVTRAKRRFLRPKAAPMALALIKTAATKVIGGAGFDEYIGPRKVTPGERHRATGLRGGALLERQ